MQYANENVELARVLGISTRQLKTMRAKAKVAAEKVAVERTVIRDKANKRPVMPETGIAPNGGYYYSFRQFQREVLNERYN